MNFALLKNYLGVPEVPGSEFQERAVAQVRAAGTIIAPGRVANVTVAGDGFDLGLNDGSNARSDYVVLAEGALPR